ncbi:MAG: sortase [Bacilli bacterium]|nr:sortase [Bacilli bacterium]
MLKRIISIIMISISIIILFYDYKKTNNNKEIIDEIIQDKGNNIYDGYIYIPKLDYKNVISKNNVLDENKVYMLSDKKLISNEYGNIILAGHNNKYVFSNIYKLSINDEIIISDFKNKYSYTVYIIKYINIKDKSVLDNIYNDKILTLITCTNNTQTRYIVQSKFNHIISHN